MLKKLSILSVSLIISGCMTGYYENNMHKIEFSALSDPSMNFSKYNNCYLITEKDLKSIDTRRKMAVLEPDLKTKGIKITKNKTSANCYLYLDYGDKKGSYVTSEAVYGQTGIQNAVTTVNALGGISTNYTPSYGVTGYRPVTSHTSFKYLRLEVRDKNDMEVWHTVAAKYYNSLASSSAELSESLDDIFPLLSDISVKNIGNNINDGYFIYSDLEVKLFSVGRKSEVKYNGLDVLEPLEEIPVKSIKEVANWNALYGETIKDTLNRWSKRIGWTVDYPNSTYYTMIENDTPYRGTFDSVVIKLLGNTNLNATFNKKENKVIIEELENVHYDEPLSSKSKRTNNILHTLWH